MLVTIGKIVSRVVFRVTALTVAYSLASYRGLHPSTFLPSLQVVWVYAAIYATLGIFYDQLFRLDKSPWRFASIREILETIRSTTFTILTFLVVIFVFDRALMLPRSTLILAWAIDIGLFSSLLLVRRAIHEKTLSYLISPVLWKTTARPATAVLLVGGLDHADAFLRQLDRDPHSEYRPVAIIAKNPNEVGRELRGLKVVSFLAGGGARLERFATQEGKRAILFLDESIAPADMTAELLGRLRTAGVGFLRLAQMIDLGDPGSKPRFKEINFEELLSRAPVRLDTSEIHRLVSGKRVLITGAGGSIGSEICRQVANLGCAHIALLDNSEFALFNIDMEICASHPTLSRRAILCDVRQNQRIKSWIFDQAPDIVFHAAALKHVPLMEDHPCESVLTNVVGTWNVVEAARSANVHHIVFISTDKAVEPSNVMGATKRLAEAVMRLHQSSSSQSRFSVVRFGNVLGSAGSVVPTFKAQIERGGPVTVTHADVERYFMTIPEAVQLVLHATAKSSVRSKALLGVFVLDMGKPVKIMDLANRLIELYGKTPGVDIEVQITGLRPGEKLTEELVDSTEEANPSEPGVIEVTDRIVGCEFTRDWVERLKAMAETGDNLQTTQMVYEYVDRLRSPRSSTIRSAS